MILPHVDLNNFFMKTSKIKKKKYRKTGWEYFDDCGICQAMKMADQQGKNLSGKELMTAFKKQNKKSYA